MAVVYTSPDAAVWSKLPGSTGITAASSLQVGSIAFGQGRWQITYLARDTDGRGFGELGVVASTDVLLYVEMLGRGEASWAQAS